MKSHLTQEQISLAIIGELPVEARRHLLDCESCQLQVSRFTGELAILGRAVRSWSDDVAQQVPHRESLPEPRRVTSVPRLVFACLATVAILFGFNLMENSRSHPSGPQPNPVNDAALLTQVDAELARTVPESMEPLAKLVAESQPEKSQQ